MNSVEVIRAMISRTTGDENLLPTAVTRSTPVDKANKNRAGSAPGLEFLSRTRVP
jgi:hypothetical protein